MSASPSRQSRAFDMLALAPAQQAALQARLVMRRIFIWCEARDFDSGLPDPAGFWDDAGDIEHAGRVYHGSGSVIKVSSLGAKGDLTIPSLTITLSGIDLGTNELARGRALAQAPISVHIGLFNPTSRALLPPLFPYFVGFIDDAPIETPAAGGPSAIVLTCRSASRALTRTNNLTRSHASEIERDPSDHFYAYTGLQLGRPLYFGRRAPTDAAAQGRRSQ